MMLAVLAVLTLQTPALAQTSRTDQVPGIEAARRVAATLQLAAQEYRGAWSQGRLAAPSEWDEAKLFVAESRRAATGLPGNARAELEPKLASVETRLAAQMPPDSLAAAARDIAARLTTLMGVSLDERPSREPSLDNGALLYRATCNRCHGPLGHGDGPTAVAEHFTPPPADLSDSAILAAVTPQDLYHKISLGVPGTQMKGFGEALSREERWDIVSYVLTFRDQEARRGKTGQLAVVFGTVRGNIGAAMELATSGDYSGAQSRELDAYMAFEAIEPQLSATDPGLVKMAEQRFSNLRGSFAARVPPEVRDRARAELALGLADAEAALAVHHSATGLFAESLLLMLREGFEAMLVVAAIMAVLVKAEARERQKNVRWGVVAAVAASLVTAAILEIILRVTPAERDALEGALMLVAAAVLFYVSYWLISKVEIAAWTRFVKGQIQRAVESGSGLALAGVAFLAVYREGFETVLFYKALYVTGGADGAGPITAGIVGGLVALLVVYIGIERFGLKIPMRPFFAVTGATLAFMAFVFAGDGIKELQEGGYVASTVLGWAPRSDFLGIYPTLESSGVQLLILAALVFAMVWTFVVRPRRLKAEGGGMPREARITAPRRTPASRGQTGVR